MSSEILRSSVENLETGVLLSPQQQHAAAAVVHTKLWAGRWRSGTDHV